MAAWTNATSNNSPKKCMLALSRPASPVRLRELMHALSLLAPCSNILEQLGSNDNIVRYYERFVDKPNNMLYILMEYCEGGDLAGVIQRCRKTGSVAATRRFFRHSVIADPSSLSPLSHRCLLPEDVVWAYLTQITLALHDCHSEMDLNGKRKPVILHRDIKPENGTFWIPLRVAQSKV